MTFKKGQPRPATAGRKKGSKNKTPASVKEALREAFDGFGGVDALLRWAKKNPTEFYKLWGRMLPQEVEVAGKDGGPVAVTVIEIAHVSETPVPTDSTSNPTGSTETPS